VIVPTRSQQLGLVILLVAFTVYVGWRLFVEAGQ
jgi:hypothetical protein